jgi:hypothetical protein
MVIKTKSTQHAKESTILLIIELYENDKICENSTEERCEKFHRQFKKRSATNNKRPVAVDSSKLQRLAHTLRVDDRCSIDCIAQCMSLENEAHVLNSASCSI